MTALQRPSGSACRRFRSIWRGCGRTNSWPRAGKSQTIHYSIASEPAEAADRTLYELYCSPARETKTKHPRGTEKKENAYDHRSSVMAFAGLVVLVSLALAQLFSPLLAASDGFRRTEPDSGLVHRLLPGGDRLQRFGVKAGQGVLSEMAHTDALRPRSSRRDTDRVAEVLKRQGGRNCRCQEWS